MVSKIFVTLVGPYLKLTVRESLVRFLDATLPKISNDWWNKTVSNKLTDNQKEHNPSSLNDLDLAALSRVFDYNWVKIRLQCNLKFEDIYFVKEIREMRIFDSHLTGADLDSLTTEKMYVHFNNIEQFMKLINVEQKYLEELEEIKRKVFTEPQIPEPASAQELESVKTAPIEKTPVPQKPEPEKPKVKIVEAKKYDSAKISKELLNTIGELEELLSWNWKEFLSIDKKISRGRRKELSPADKAERQNLQTTVNNKLNELYARQDNCSEKIRQSRPPLDQLNSEHLTNTDFPEQICFGTINLASPKEYYAKLNRNIPRLLPFPFKKAVWFSDNKEDKALLFQLLLCLLFSLPIGRFIIYASDLKLGESLGNFFPLFKLKNLAPNGRVLTDTKEIESMLQEQAAYLDTLSQGFQNQYDWESYNRQNSEAVLPYRLVLLFDTPEELSDTSIGFIRRLIEHGPKRGVLPVFEYKHNDDKKYAKLHETIQNHAAKIDALLDTSEFKKYAYVSVTEKPEAVLSDQYLKKMAGILSHAYNKQAEEEAERQRQAASINKPIDDLWPESDFWKHTSIDGIKVPIGWNEKGEEVYFEIGGTGTEHHTLIGGSSGSGKSNLMHVIIHSLCHYYHPDELAIYLLDYKQGTESQLYTKPYLPHALLVAIQSDPEYGSAVFKHLVEEKDRRADLFKSVDEGKAEFPEYRKKGNKCPRILLIVDEFQGLFAGDRQTSENTLKDLVNILRQGRSYGIHILLSTQTLASVHYLDTSDLKSQLGCRIALSCMEEDSRKILGNEGAKDLNKELFEAYINTAQQNIKGNRLFRNPFAKDTTCLEHSKKFEDEALKRDFPYTKKIFNGTMLPHMPPEKSFFYHLPNCEDGELFPMCIGESLIYEAYPLTFTFNKNLTPNLLIAGAHSKIHDGLLMSIILSIQSANKNAGQKEKTSIIYLNGKTGQKAPAFLDAFPDIRQAADVEELGLKAIVEEIKKKSETRRVLIIDGLESINEFRFEQSPYGAPKGPDIPANLLLLDILTQGPPLGTVVIAFSENWNMCYQVCSGYISRNVCFEKRIGFNLGEADAGKLTWNTAGFKGIGGESCAVYYDRSKNKCELFRPYVKEDKKQCPQK